MEITFRPLQADEIDVRVSTVSDKGVSLLLYKDARADMIILDETVGAANWQRRHTRDNANCIVSIWDEEKEQWIEKEDTGTESFTEKEKGLASDSFKRACTNWGIGRELYTAPFIWVAADKIEWTNRNGKQVPKTRFSVSRIEYDGRGRIIELVIISNKNTVVYSYPCNVPPPPKQEKPKMITNEQGCQIEDLVFKTKTDKAKMLEHYKIKRLQDMTFDAANNCIEMLLKKTK